ncbi:pseudouridylate synthase 7 homolog [Parasteatoda tepidariorum]|uniref:pseudouridylate synthase 7 homolog n=1 Tax=Parasteatoda tepidariorum TaxID=114398 RepID=UPI00077F9E1C|nr:pseudouridylate synthase 7 homolog [Parasteatoda tepidariorum]
MDVKINLKRQLEEDSKESNFSPKKVALDTNAISKCVEKEDKTILNSETKVDNNKIIYTRASESDVGITEYISSLPGFSAILKERYSDFIVNEIDSKLNVVRLTNLEKPPEPVLDSKLSDLLVEDTLKKLQDLANNVEECNEVLIDVSEMDKNSRKEIHIGLRQSYNNIDSATEDKDGKKYIIVKKCFQRGKRFQPPAGGNYSHFVLYKENKDTIDAINTISSFLRVQPKIFSYAGTKDKRAKTSQLVSAYRLPCGKLLGINKHFQMIKVGNIQFKPDQIRLGDLAGNHFNIVLRQFYGSEDVIKQAMQSLSTKGFINYYGMQRFGTSCVPTHAIGRSLLKGDWAHAIDLILTPKPEDVDDLSSAKKIWYETKNADKALENLKRRNGIEGKLLSGLACNNKKDLVNSLNTVPRNMRLMYIHSYQSFIWNKVVSKRIQTHGLQVLKGDLISKESDVPEDSLLLNKEDNRKAVLSNMVKFVTDQDIGNANITDVLLPLPGHSVTLPNNETGKWYEEALREDGMSFDNFKSKTKSYSLSGDYRKIIVIPEEVKWEIIHYNDNTIPLSLSDLDVLNGITLPDFPSSGLHKALKVEFNLPSSSYATMALREIQKSS